MFQEKFKAVTFSFDDAVLQDKRLIKMFQKYGLKGTFNLNSGFLGKAGSLVREDVTVAHCKPRKCEVAEIYKGQEIAAHGINHPALCSLPTRKVVNEVEGDRLVLGDIAGYEIVGFAYPCSTELSMNNRVVKTIREYTGIQYCRTTKSTYNFEPQKDLLRFNPTLHHNEWDKLFELGEKFVAMDTIKPKIFYIWGHSYEFDIDDSWDKFEEFCKLISGKEDIFYGTNKEVLLDKDLMEYMGISLHGHRKWSIFNGIL